jgi:hypothetical protein
VDRPSAGMGPCSSGVKTAGALTGSNSIEEVGEEEAANLLKTVLFPKNSAGLHSPFFTIWANAAWAPSWISSSVRSFV